MRNFSLSPEQLVELRAAHKAERNRRAAYKINAVILLGTGWTLTEVSEALLLDDETLRSYVEKYRTDGLSTLLQTNYAGRRPRLDDKQQKTLCRELDTRIYLTTAAIVAYVKKTFSVQYTISGMTDWLHRLGYTFKKPKLVPGNPDVDAQEEFIRYYEAFMEEKKDNVEVLFLDAVHPEHNTMAAYGWIKKGDTRCLKTNSGRQRLNLHGAINAETMEMTVIESPSINQDSTEQLLHMLDNKYRYAKEVVVLLDNASYHHAQPIKDLVERSPRLKLVFLPTYSPQLNLIERVWRFFKKQVLYNQYYENLDAFRKASIAFFRNIKKHKEALRSLLGGGFQDLLCA